MIRMYLLYFIYQVVRKIILPEKQQIVLLR